MRHILWLMLICTCALPVRASADAFYTYIQYSCNSQADFVQIEWIATYDEVLADKTRSQENTWNPWALVSGDEQYIKETKSVQKRCELSSGSYEVEIGPVICNRNTQGRNGAVLKGFAAITKDGKPIAREMFGICSSDELTAEKDKITTKLKFSPGSNSEVEQKTLREYYGFQ